jgi:hypothetical protein
MTDVGDPTPDAGVLRVWMLMLPLLLVGCLR